MMNSFILVTFTPSALFSGKPLVAIMLGKAAWLHWYLEGEEEGLQAEIMRG